MLKPKAKDYVSWEPLFPVFLDWLGERKNILKPGLTPKPTIKVLTFLALLDAKKACTYDEIREIFYAKKVIVGDVPDNTLRTSVLNLARTLDKFKHAYELQSFRGQFQLVRRGEREDIEVDVDEREEVDVEDLVVLLLEPPVLTAKDIARILIEKGILTFHGLYFLEWAARSCENYSFLETEARVDYEAGSWERLGIENRLSKTFCKDSMIGFVGLATGEGLAEIELLKKILDNNKIKQVHYLAIDSSPRLLRNHMGLLKETFNLQIEEGRLICCGVAGDIFSGLPDALQRARNELKKRHIIPLEFDFLPHSCGMLVTYLGNSLGNNHQDQETEFFSTVRGAFQNHALEILVGVSVMHSNTEVYKKNWIDFLLQTPLHLLETKKLLKSSRLSNQIESSEFVLSKDKPEELDARCSSVIPELYMARHQIKGQIYRFYYRLAFDLELAENIKTRQQVPKMLPKGTLILLVAIIKYNIQTLVNGVEKAGLFKVKYDKKYHLNISTPNGEREYAIFSAYSEK